MDQDIVRKLNERELSKIDDAISLLVNDKKQREKEESERIRFLKQKAAKLTTELADLHHQKSELDALLVTTEESIQALRCTRVSAMANVEEMQAAEQAVRQRNDTLRWDIQKANIQQERLENLYSNLFGVTVDFVDDNPMSDNIEVHVKRSTYSHDPFVINCRKDKSRKGLNLAIECIDPSDSHTETYEKAYQLGRVELWQLVCLLRLGGSFPPK